MAQIDIAAAWERSAETIARSRHRRILVLGGVDCGKSTYCEFLNRRLMQGGHRTAIVDADIGQKDIGPPACLTLGYPERKRPLTATTPDKFYFIGAVNPAKHLLPMVVGTRRLIDAAAAPFVIINTTGMVHGLGRILKGYKIEAARPHVIVALQRTQELESILSAYRNHRIIRLRPSPKAVSKTLEHRKFARQEAFARYFAAAAAVSMDVEKLIFQRTLLFSGKALKDSGHIHAEQTSEGILAISDDDPTVRFQQVQRIPTGFTENLLCGVADRGNSGIGLAIIQGIDFASGTITLLTPLAAEKMKIVQMGNLHLLPDGTELHAKSPGPF